MPIQQMLFASLPAGGITITPGTPDEFEADGADPWGIAMLTSTKAIGVYRDRTSGYGAAIIFDVSGSTITPGTAFVYNSASTVSMHVAKVTATEAIVVYRDGGDSNKGKTMILSISGSTITGNTAADFEAGATNNMSVIALSTAQAIVTYRDGGNSNYGTSNLINITSTTTVTPKTPAVFVSSLHTASPGAVGAFDSSQAIVVWKIATTSYGTAAILNVSGDTITPVAGVTVESISSTNHTIQILTGSKAIVVYRDGVSPWPLSSAILNVSGSTITPETAVDLASGNSSNMASMGLSSTKIAVAYLVSLEGLAIAAGIAGNTTTPDDAPITFDAVNAVIIVATALSSTQGIVMYRVSGGNDPGWVIVLGEPA